MLTIYGTDWCEDTQHTKEHLDDVGVPYDYVNIETDARAAAWVCQQNDGQSKTPTVRMEGLVLSEPSDAELDSALRARGILA